MTRVELVSLALGLVLVTSITLRAQQPPARSDEELAKQLANPVASLVSLPLQFNWDSGVGPDEGLRSIVNFQPVLPMRVNDDWNLIGRFILPFVGQPSLVTDGQATFGTGDILLSGFLSPAQPGAVVWGVGPALTLPTTTDPFLGSGKWSVGPTGIVLKQSGPWTYGALFNHLWSYASVSQSAKNRPEINSDLSSAVPQLHDAHGRLAGRQQRGHGELGSRRRAVDRTDHLYSRKGHATGPVPVPDGRRCGRLRRIAGGRAVVEATDPVRGAAASPIAGCTHVITHWRSLEETLQATRLAVRR